MKTFTLPIKLESIANKRWHWRKKANYVRGIRDAVYLKCPGFEVPCVVTMTRIAPRSLDDDNNVSAFKAVRDSIAKRLEVDDRDPRVLFRCGQRKGKPKEYAIEVQLQEIA